MEFAGASQGSWIFPSVRRLTAAETPKGGGSTWSVFADAGEANCDGGDEHGSVFAEGRGSSQEGVGQGF